MIEKGADDKIILIIKIKRFFSSPMARNKQLTRTVPNMQKKLK